MLLLTITVRTCNEMSIIMFISLIIQIVSLLQNDINPLAAEIIYLATSAECAVQLIGLLQSKD